MSGRHVGWRAIGREAWRDVISGTARTALCTLLLALCMALLAGADYLTIAGLTAKARAWVDAGASTYVLTLRSGIDGAACDHLVSLDGVQAAGATRQVDTRMTFATLPSTGIPMVEATPGFLGVFDEAYGAAGTETGRADGHAADASTGGMGVLLSRTVADQLGARAGDRQQLADGREVTVRDVYRYDDDGRESGYGYAVVVPMNDDSPYTSCIVRTWPTPVGIETLLRTAIVTSYSAGDKPRVAQLNASLGRVAPATDDYAGRATAWTPWMMLVLSAALGFAMTRARRLELASSLHAGYPKPALTAQILLESCAAFLLAACAVSPLFAYVVLDAPGADLMPVLDALARVPAAGFAGLLAGTAFALLLTRERQLFNYFKRR
ncbi:hypothetical protein G1C96_0883 [Bifidobacterium sp. DSM 109958]|uniref:ABC transporter permease n=1 Tax=Bifidobacterium moraviense TaxID=2675323 RepID=A0A7Y0F1I3_9BIFI|nr:hypothetical protein [Bifidobacterium sp. DSM 109958]NMN00305.1 hypothetical protein [Bifidobacterium sp. DSM 109958]